MRARRRFAAVAFASTLPLGACTGEAPSTETAGGAIGPDEAEPAEDPSAGS